MSAVVKLGTNRDMNVCETDTVYEKWKQMNWFLINSGDKDMYTHRYAMVRQQERIAG